MENFLKFQSEERCTLNFIRRNIIGNDAVVKGPFGFKKLVYCDYVASGKPLKCIEDYIQSYVYPYYANTHTTTSFAARQTTRYREDARNIIKSCLNCGDDDVLIFCGNGATGTVHKLIHALSIKQTASTTVVLTGPFEHHSNILPWKEAGCIVQRISHNDKGLVDLVALERKLQLYKAKQYTMLVSMSAASNVTGIMTDTKAVAELSHQYGALSIWDYAAGAPYLAMDMNPSKNGYKDAVFISPHKFVGGVGTPGILVAKRHLFVNEVPQGCGGGTVNWVTREQHEYLVDIQEREEGGTPAIIESIRAGLTFQIKRAVGQDIIDQREEYLCMRAFDKWSRNNNIVILGNLLVKRLPIFSFLVLHKQSGLYLHHNFVSMLLNDLYGIQSRGGCACAGPYAQDLLNMSDEIAEKFTKLLSPADGKTACQVMKPGFCRLNIPYFADEQTIEYILEAVDQVALYGWMLLPFYRYYTCTGEWFFHSTNQTATRSLQHITYTRAGMVVEDSQIPVHREGDISYSDMLCDAAKFIVCAKELSTMIDFNEEGEANDVTTNREKEDPSLLWFVQPKLAHSLLTSYDTETHVSPNHTQNNTSVTDHSMPLSDTHKNVSSFQQKVKFGTSFLNFDTRTTLPQFRSQRMFLPNHSEQFDQSQNIEFKVLHQEESSAGIANLICGKKEISKNCNRKGCTDIETFKCGKNDKSKKCHNKGCSIS